MRLVSLVGWWRISGAALIATGLLILAMSPR